MNKVFLALRKFVEGEVSFEVKEKEEAPRRESNHHEKTIKERYVLWHDKYSIPFFKGIYLALSVVISLSIISILLITVSYLPPSGEFSNPVNNEVSQRYIEKGMEETGAVNIVAGVILDYRAFDTFGEACVLFVSSCSVLMLLKKDKKGKPQGLSSFEPQRDPIVKNIAKILVPLTLMFGIYIVLNGHISPGGGFAGGAIMGASLILCSSAFGYRQIKTIITEKVVRNITFASLAFYAVAKGYSFFTGANHIPTGIPLGVPGHIISAGLILPLNIAVGLIVTCTMYSFYSLFSKGEI